MHSFSVFFLNVFSECRIKPETDNRNIIMQGTFNKSVVYIKSNFAFAMHSNASLRTEVTLKALFVHAGFRKGCAGTQTPLAAGAHRCA